MIVAGGGGKVPAVLGQKRVGESYLSRPKSRKMLIRVICMTSLNLALNAPYGNEKGGEAYRLPKTHFSLEYL